MIYFKHNNQNWLIYSNIAVDCEWDEFGDWSTCSNIHNPCQESGNKKRSRSKKIIEKYGGKSCEGSAQEKEVCDETCPGL